MQRIGVLLSGCGALDGSDPTQTIAVRAAADRAGDACFGIAPDVPQADVVGPAGVESQAGRNAFEESCRLFEGRVEVAARVQADELDLLVVPGGLGAVKTLCTSARATVATLEASSARLALALLEQGGALVALGEACVWAAHLLAPRTGLRFAGGAVEEIDRALRDLGHEPVEGAEPVRTDAELRVFSMALGPLHPAHRVLADVERGIDAARRVLTHRG